MIYFNELQKLFPKRDGKRQPNYAFRDAHRATKRDRKKRREMGGTMGGSWRRPYTRRPLRGFSELARKQWWKVWSRARAYWRRKFFYSIGV